MVTTNKDVDPKDQVIIIQKFWEKNKRLMAREKLMDDELKSFENQRKDLN